MFNNDRCHVEAMSHSESTKHDVPLQMCGFLHQKSMALLTLLKSEELQTEMRIECLGDISLMVEGELRSIEIKHHDGDGKMGTGGRDLWDALDCWMDIDLERSATQFILITTSPCVPKSAPYYLRAGNERNTQNAFDLMVNEAEKRSDARRSKFADLSKIQKKNFIERIVVCDGSAGIEDVPEKIKEQFISIVRPGILEEAYENVMGWWDGKIIDCLRKKITSISKLDVCQRIQDTNHLFNVENLPILDEADWDESLMREDMNFIRQMNLIKSGSTWIGLSRKYYLSAASNRARWLREFWVNESEIKKFDEKLKNEWELYFERMKRRLERIEIDSSVDLENQKIKEGTNLLETLEDKDIRIKPHVDDKSIVRGSFHILSDVFEIGWHVDYLERLRDIDG